jgi:hypothetical protein
MRKVSQLLDLRIGTSMNMILIGKKLLNPKEYCVEFLKFSPKDYVIVLSDYSLKYFRKGDKILGRGDDLPRVNLKLDEYLKVLINSLRTSYVSILNVNVSDIALNRERRFAWIPPKFTPKTGVNDEFRAYSNQNYYGNAHDFIMGGFKIFEDTSVWFYVYNVNYAKQEGEVLIPPNLSIHEDYLKKNLNYFIVEKTAILGLL